MDLRFQPGQFIRVELLPSREVLNVRIVRLARGSAAFLSDRSLASGQSFRIELDDLRISGVVAACVLEGQHYALKAEIQNAVALPSDLARLMTALGNNGVPGGPRLPRLTGARQRKKAAPAGRPKIMRSNFC
jgi:hypothetical protein